MRIIFDSEEEKEKFFNNLSEGTIICPSDVGFNDMCEHNSTNCHDCWRASVAWEIKEPEA